MTAVSLYTVQVKKKNEEGQFLYRRVKVPFLSSQSGELVFFKI
jgi:hypothetical protein